VQLLSTAIYYNCISFELRSIGYSSNEISTTMHSFIFKCTDVDCGQIVVCRYRRKDINNEAGSYEYMDFFPTQTFPKKICDDVIKNISKDFVEIYNQSLRAEDDCKDIAGAGYKKALEFIYQRLRY
jgi:hypothetical protein